MILTIERHTYLQGPASNIVAISLALDLGRIQVDRKSVV